MTGATSSLQFLVVDDNEVDRMACRRILQKGPWIFELHEAVTLNEARERIGKCTYDCVLLDRRLPDGDGKSLLPELQGLPSAPAVLIITGYGNEDSGVAVIREGVQDYVSKDRLASDLLRSVRFALERRHLEEKLHHANADLAALSQHDPLTHLLNRRGFELRLASELRRAQRDGTQLYVLIADADLFKQINDLYGHRTGDLVLTAIAQQVETSCRATDHCARIGGDEFAILLPNISMLDARNIAERLRMLVHQVRVPTQGGVATVTVSIALGDVPQDALTTTDLLGHVGFTLAQSKQLGRDRVAIASLGRRRHLSGGNRTLDDLRKHLREDSFEIVKIAVIDLRTQAVVARELRAVRRHSPDVSERAFYAAALNDGHLVELDLAQMRQRIEVAAAMKSNLPIHLGIFCDTLLSDRYDELGMLLADASRQRPLVLSLNVALVPTDVRLLILRLEELRRHGIKLELVDVNCDGDTLGAVMSLRPEIVRLSAELLVHALAATDYRLRYERLTRMLAAVGCELIADGVNNDQAEEFVSNLGIHNAICEKGRTK